MLHMKLIRIFRILVPTPGGSASSHFWQIRPNPTGLAGFPDLADVSPAAVHENYLQVKEMKLVLACRYMSDFTNFNVLSITADSN